MASSGNTNFNLTTSQIISQSLMLLGVIGPNEPVSGEDYNVCLTTLNMMLKGWEAKGIYVSTETEGTLFLANNQFSYQLGNSSPDKASTGSSEVETQITASYTTGASTFLVNSTVNMTASDNIGICLDNNTIYWSTISVVISSTSVSINGTLPSAASQGNYLYSFTTTVGRPLHISSIRVRRSGGTDTTIQAQSNDYRLTEVSRSRYFAIPNKGVSGTPIQFYLDKQNSFSTLYVYPAPSNVSYRLKFTYRRIFQDFTNPTDNADLPQEWLKPIVLNLCVDVAPIYGKELKVGMQSIQGCSIKDQATIALADALSNSQEKTRFKFSPRIPD